MDGGQRNLGRTAVLGGTIVVAVGLIAAGFLMPNKPDSVQIPEEPTVQTPAPTTLHFRTNRGDLAGMQELIDAGADVDALGEESGLAGLTPLMIAVRNRESEAAALLLSAGANPNEAGAGARTALFVATEQGDTDLVELLLEAGADPDRVASGGRTPLMSASTEDEPDVVILLLNAGADARAKDTSGRTALDLASIRSDAPGRAIAGVLTEASAR